MPTTPDTPDTTDTPERSRGRFGSPDPTRTWITVGVVAALIVGGATAGYVSATGGMDTLASGDAAGTEVDEESASVFDDPGAFLGETVHVSATVNEVLDLNVFRAAGPDEQTLLIVHKGTPSVVAEQVVDIEGVITRFTKEEVEAEFTGDELADTIWVLGDADGYGLVARTVTITTDVELADVPTSLPIPVASAAAVAEAPAKAAPPGGSAPVSEPAVPDYSSTSASGTAPAPAPAGGGTSGGGKSDGGGTSGGDGKSGGSGSGGSSTRPEGSKPAPAKISYTGKSSSGQHTDETNFEAKLRERNGEPIEGAKVTFELKGDSSARRFKAWTDPKGVASTTEELTETPGTYRLIVRYKKLGGRVKDKATFIVEKDDSVLNLSSETTYDDEKGNNGNGNGGENGNGNGGRDEQVTLTAVVGDADDGAAIVERTVYFYADGELFGSAMTDDTGMATIEVPSEYSRSGASYEARFEGDQYYLGSGDAV